MADVPEMGGALFVPYLDVWLSVPCVRWVGVRNAQSGSDPGRAEREREIYN